MNRPAASTRHRLGMPPRNNTANLIRGLSLCSAVAASLFGPTVLAGRSSLQTDLVVFVVTLFTIGAALLALRGRLVAPRSLRAWCGWALGSTVLLLIGVLSLGEATIMLLAAEGATLAALTVAVWLASVLLNAAEAARAFDGARRLWLVRHAMYRVGVALLIALAAWHLGDLALPRLQRATLATPFESLATGAAVALALVCALLLGLGAWHLPKALAQRQCDGRVSASAASESMWFCALAAITLPLSIPGWAWAEPWAPVAFAGWGELALHALTIVVAHGTVRLVFGGAGSIPPMPLLVLVRAAALAPSARQMLARLPSAWGAGPVCRVMPPAAAADAHGAHLQIAALAGTEALLFPRAANDLEAWRDALPAWQHWRALATQELYADPERWREVLGTWQTPQTWVLLVEDGGSRPAAEHGAGWADSLPDARTERVNLGQAGEDHWPPSLTHWPVWTDDTGRGDAPAFAAWLRAQLPPELPRRILLLHARAEAPLAAALAAQLDGRADAQGRFVEAWTVAEHGDLDWRMPLGGFRLMAQVNLAALQRRVAAGRADRFERFMSPLWQAMAPAMLGVRVDDEVPPFDVVLLHTESLRAAAAGWRTAPEAQPLLGAAARRLGIRLDRGEATVCALDAQIAAPLADPTALDATARQALANRLAEQILADAWVALATARDGPPAAPADTPAPTTAPTKRAAPAAPPPAHRVLVLQENLGSGLPREQLQLVGVLLAERTEGRVRIELGNVGGETLAPENLAFYDAVILLTSPALMGVLPFDRMRDTMRAIDKPLWRAALVDMVLPDDVAALPTLSPRHDDGHELALVDPRDPGDASGTLRLRADAVALALRTALVRGGLRPAAPVKASAAPLESAASAIESAAAPAPGDGLFDAVRGTVVTVLGLRDGGLAAGLADGRVAWQRRGDPAVRTRDAHRGAVTALVELPGGRLVSASTGGEVALWAAGDTLTMTGMIGHHEAAVRALAPMGRYVVAGDDGAALHFWPLSDEDRATELTGWGGPILAVDNDADTVFVACGSAGLWFRQIGSDDPPRRGGSDDLLAVNALACLGDNLYLGGQDRTGRGLLRREQLRRDGLPTRWVSGLDAGPVSALLVLPDERVVAGTVLGHVLLWSPSSGANAMAELGTPGAEVTGLAALDVATLAVLGADGVVRRVDLPAPVAA